MFTSGAVVRIQGLVNRQDLNGELGVVDQTENGKTTLSLVSNPDVKLAMRSKNLCLAVKCGTCDEYVANEGDLCAECMRVKRARVDPAVGASVLDVLAAAALLPARLEPPGPLEVHRTSGPRDEVPRTGPPARPAAASPATHNPPESPAPVVQAPVGQPPATPVGPVAQPQAAPVNPVAQAPATPVVQPPGVQAPVQAPIAPVVQVPPVQAALATEQAELEERIVQMLDSFGGFLLPEYGDLFPKCTDEVESLLRQVIRDRKSVSFKFLFRLSQCYQSIHILHVKALCERSLQGLLDQPIEGHLQRIDRLTEIVEEQFPFFKKMLEMDKLCGFYNNGFIPEAKFRSKFEALYGQAVDVCHQHLVGKQTKDFTNHLYFLYSIAFFDRETFTRFFQSDRFPDEIDLYCNMALIAGDYTKNIYYMFGHTISGGIQNKLAIFKAMSEIVPKTKVDYDAAVVKLLESIEGPIERTLAVCTKLLDEELIDDKHFEFVVDKMFA